MSMTYSMKIWILPILVHYWPFFGQFWPWYQCQRLKISIFVFVQSGLNEIGKQILNNYVLKEENAYFGLISPLLACFWPVLAPVSVSKAQNEHVGPSSDWID